MRLVAAMMVLLFGACTHQVQYRVAPSGRATKDATCRQKQLTPGDRCEGRSETDNGQTAIFLVLVTGLTVGMIGLGEAFTPGDHY